METTTNPNITSPTNNLLAKALEDHRKRVANPQLPSPHILVLGASGTGKSSSIRTLPPDKTLVINVENKILPFKNHADFVNQAANFSYVSEVDALIKLAKDDIGIKYVVIDSFTKYLEILMIEARARNKGFDIFNYYNAMVGAFLENIKKITNKILILTAIDQLEKVESDSGAMLNKRFCATEGKWFGKMEKEFAIVLYTQAKPVANSNPVKVDYLFTTNTDGINSAKSPADMFPYTIPNSLGDVVKKVEEFFKLS